jgi:drug/metabolite transporter (DMT)-like permease
MKLLLAVTRGLILDTAMRRRAMGGCVLAACAMTFAGSSFLARFLADNLRVFILFWLVCGWLTVTAVLLAIYDLLLLRARARIERKKLRGEIFGDDKDAHD